MNRKLLLIFLALFLSFTSIGAKVYKDGVFQFEGDISEIYFKSIGTTPPIVPPITPPILTGAYSAQVNKATKLDKKTWSGATTTYGFYKDPITGNGSEIGIPANMKTYFLIDPKTVLGAVKSIKVQFTDFAQHDNLSVTIYIIGREDNIVSPAIWGNPYGIPLSSNTHGPWVPRMGHKDEYRYLIEVTETKGQSIHYNIYWWGS